mmetsp:Transcript_43077/g.71610  ORF Transcript_43077/g.71610 Transcript_43077/m.71610 type:complete len:145 (-) Transcript_43077:371-805(-)|eukprot:CAMPEP_0119304826 /NCGR_PEP_ID=MMETSP1333-20130426/5952_1 /TAXON_ID=418940 /ORGANISM="Scyphosphaera apsteinii, Strain RCC1455" /LENGTH=144 /DNA_ID=CAMNT_0007307769 /DNA_START=31 /DNA_END=465 /DNA_ORIENTATION=-
MTEGSSPAASMPSLADGEISFNPPLDSGSPFNLSFPLLTGASARWQKGGGAAGLVQMMRDQRNIATLHTLIRFSTAMALVPAITMACCYCFVLDLAFTFRSNGDRMLYAGIAAIASVQIVIVAFIVHAFNEPPDAPAENAKKHK